MPQSRTDRELAGLRRLLEHCLLPVDGIAEQFGDNYALVTGGDEILAAAGVEVYGSYGLLRSVAVAPEQRNGRIGASIVSDRIGWARRHDLRTLFLLTTTAAAFFEKLGFIRVPRESAPPEIAASREFRQTCPSSAICMRLDL